MAIVAGNVLGDARALLNDSQGAIYPDSALLPILRKAYTELQTKLASLGYSSSKDTSISIPIIPSVKSISDGSGLPTDFLLPIEVAERLMGSQDKYIPMMETTWEPDEKPAQELRYWTWREESMYFVGATSTRELQIKYYKSLAAISDTTSPIVINNSQIYLAQRTAALAAMLIGSNQTRANALMSDLMGQQGPWEDLKQTLMHKMQSIPVRRRRTRWRKR